MKLRQLKRKKKIKNQKEFEAYPAEEVTEEAAGADEPENVEPEPEVAPSEQLDEPDPREPEEYLAQSLPEDEYATPPIQPEKKVRKGLGQFFSDMFNKPKNQEPVKNQTPDKVVTMRKTTDRTVVQPPQKPKEEPVIKPNAIGLKKKIDKGKETMKIIGENVKEKSKKIKKIGKNLKETTEKGLKNVKKGAKKITKFFKKK